MLLRVGAVEHLMDRYLFKKQWLDVAWSLFTRAGLESQVTGRENLPSGVHSPRWAALTVLHRAEDSVLETCASTSS